MNIKSCFCFSTKLSLYYAYSNSNLIWCGIKLTQLIISQSSYNLIISIKCVIKG